MSYSKPNSSKEFIVKHDVPILDEHEIKDAEGQVVHRIDAKELQRFANTANRRYQETGDEIPIIIGHTKDGEREDLQPEIIGYAKDLKVKPLFKTGRQALHVGDWQIFRNKLNKAKNYPRRSVELWLSDGKIDPIAVLGATTPERDLGMLRYNRNGEKVYRRILPTLKRKRKYEKEDTPMDSPTKDQPSEIATEVFDMLTNSAPWKFLEQLMEEVEGADDDQDYEDDMDDFEDGTVTYEDLDPDEQESFDNADEDPLHYETFPGGHNTHMPSFNEPQRKSRRPRRRPHNRQPSQSAREAILGLRTEQPAQYSREPEHSPSDRIRLSQIERENQRLSNELANQRLQLQRERREKDLIQLEAEGYVFDRKEELDLITPLSEQAYKYHMSRARRLYSRAPVNSSFMFGPSATNMPNQGLDREGQIKAQELALEKGISFAEALSQMSGNEDTF